MKKTLYMLFLIPVCILSMLTLIYLFSKDEPLFFLKNIKISGVSQLGDADIMSKVTPFLRENLLKIDAAKMKEAVISHPFVKEVSIKRVFPFSIVIDVKEKKPSALWVNGQGEVLVLDEGGEPYRGFVKGDGKGMFIINARDKGDVKSVYREINGWIIEGIIKRDNLSEVAYNEGNVTLFGFDDGVEIILGKEDLKKRLKRAVKAFEYAKKRGVLIERIDARYEEGPIVKERKG